MPTTESVESALRALGWMPVTGDRSASSRAWEHPEVPHVVIRVPRTDWIDARIAARILRRARRNPYR